MRSFALLVLTACSQTSYANPQVDLPEPPKPVQLDRPAVVQFHMRTHLDDLKAVQRHLIAGKLDDAQAAAFMLTKPANDPGLAQWQMQTDRVVTEAKALTDAKTVTDGCKRLARVAEACAECHVRTQTAPVFPAATAPPTEDVGRHAWAVDRLWEGMVAGTDGPWVSGLEVLAGSPIPATTLTEGSTLAARLQQQATTALDRHRSQSETLDSRSATYGEMLVTCAACHSSLPER